MQDAFARLGEEAVSARDGLSLQRAGVALAKGANSGRFEALCGRIIEEFAGSDDAGQLRAGGWILLLPQAARHETFRVAGIAMLEQAAELDPEHHMVPVEEALIACRSGRPAEAEELLATITPHKNEARKKMVLLLKAICSAKLGARDDARAYLEKVQASVDERAEDLARGRYSVWWNVGVRHQLFLKQAAALIEDGG